MCLLFRHNSHQNREPIMLKLCWHNLPLYLKTFSKAPCTHSLTPSTIPTQNGHFQCRNVESSLVGMTQYTPLVCCGEKYLLVMWTRQQCWKLSLPTPPPPHLPTTHPPTPTPHLPTLTPHPPTATPTHPLMPHPSAGLSLCYTTPHAGTPVREKAMKMLELGPK